MRGTQWIKGALCAIIAGIGVQTACAESDYSFRGEKTLGLNIGYCGSNRSALAGLEFSYRFNRWFRLAPEANYVFRRHDRDALLVDLNAQFPLLFSRDRMAIYPQIGANFSSWNYHGDTSDAQFDDSVTRISRFGLNFGAGYELDLTPTLRMGVKAEYIMVKDFNSVNAIFKIGYRF